MQYINWFILLRILRTTYKLWCKKLQKFQETTQANILLATELSRRNSKWLPIIQESIQRINTILEELTTIEEPQSIQTAQLEHMLELEDNHPHSEQEIPYNPEVQQEEHHPTNKTDIATPSAPWDYLPYGWKTRSQEAFLWWKHKSQLKCARQQDTSYWSSKIIINT